MRKLPIVILCAIITSCKSYVPFTEDLKQNFKKDGIDLTKLQYYSEKGIVLNRRSTNTVKGLQKGDIAQSSTFIREKISFGGSPIKPLAGVCRLVDDGQMYICFEAGSLEDKGILFHSVKSGEYQFYSKLNYIQYDGNLYEIEKGQFSQLLVSRKVTKKYITNKRKVKGLQVE